MSDKLKHIKCKHIQHRHFLITHSKFYNLKFECYKENQKCIGEKICDPLINIYFKHTNQKLLIFSSNLSFQVFLGLLHPKKSVILSKLFFHLIIEFLHFFYCASKNLLLKSCLPSCMILIVFQFFW